MSSVFHIGFSPPSSVSPAFAAWLKSSGLSDSAIDDISKESFEAARVKAQDASWWMVSLGNMSPDLDFVYTIPGSLRSGLLKELIAAVRGNPEIERLCVFIYDVGTQEERVYEIHSLTEIEKVLSEYYEHGAPLQTDFHKFLRKGRPNTSGLDS